MVCHCRLQNNGDPAQESHLIRPADGDLGWQCEDLLQNRNEWWVPGKIVEIRRRLEHVWRVRSITKPLTACWRWTRDPCMNWNPLRQRHSEAGCGQQISWRSFSSSHALLRCCRTERRGMCCFSISPSTTGSEPRCKPGLAWSHRVLVRSASGAPSQAPSACLTPYLVVGWSFAAC